MITLQSRYHKMLFAWNFSKSVPMCVLEIFIFSSLVTVIILIISLTSIFYSLFFFLFLSFALMRSMLLVYTTGKFSNFNTIKMAHWPFFQGRRLWKKLYVVATSIKPKSVFQWNSSQQTLELQYFQASIITAFQPVISSSILIPLKIPLFPFLSALIILCSQALSGRKGAHSLTRRMEVSVIPHCVKWFFSQPMFL